MSADKPERHWILPCIHFVATSLILLTTLSVPIIPNMYYAQMGLKPFNGSLNGLPVQDLTILRLGNWAACPNSQNFTCLPKAIAYKVAITDTNSTRIIVESKWTGGLLTQPFAFIFAALLTIASVVDIEEINKYFLLWFELLAIMMTLIAAVFNILLVSWVHTAMETTAEEIVTTVGPALFLTVFADVFLFGGVFLRHYSKARKAAAPENSHENMPRSFQLWFDKSQDALAKYGESHTNDLSRIWPY